MDANNDLLIEIGTEELPPAALTRLADAFRQGVQDQLDQRGLNSDCIETFATPRRLALLIRNLPAAQPDQEVLRRGPAVKAAFGADGAPSKAAQGFARSCGAEVSDLQREQTAKGEWLVFHSVNKGLPIAELVAPMVEHSLSRLPIPKRMRWGDRDEEFVRPVHWVCVLFGSEVIPARILGIEATGSTYGHRFHHPESIAIGRAADYAAVLREQGRVEPDFARRRDRVRTLVEEAAASVQCTVSIDAALLDEVTALCEWPAPIMGSFDERFLEVPPEALIETMQKNQKYFPVFGPDGELKPRFIAISNIESKDPEQVRKGNERVIRPRFADAAFFWHQDLKQPLEAYQARLEQVIFQKDLGTLAEKTERVAGIAVHIADALGNDAGEARRAARLAKCDLMTQMIFEFASLQGIMGRYYAQRSGESDCVAQAMEEQYLPRHAGDRLPRSDCGLAVALADRLDSMVGIFAIGQRPTGVKDPYGLRRAAIGTLRILIETPLPLDLRDLLQVAAGQLRGKVAAADAAVADVLQYVMERLKGYYQDQGIGADSVAAVLATGVTIPSDIDRRIRAVEAFRALPEAAALAAANKRIGNILKKAGDEAPQGISKVDSSQLAEQAEIELNRRIIELADRVAPLKQAQDYEAVLVELAQLRPEVDAFFDQVMVMADDKALRTNRLQLLHSLQALFVDVADISHLAVA